MPDDPEPLLPLVPVVLLVPVEPLELEVELVLELHPLHPMKHARDRTLRTDKIREQPRTVMFMLGPPAPFILPEFTMSRLC
jgi:hypothetical protein